MLPFLLLYIISLCLFHYILLLFPFIKIKKQRQQLHGGGGIKVEDNSLTAPDNTTDSVTDTEDLKTSNEVTDIDTTELYTNVQQQNTSAFLTKLQDERKKGKYNYWIISCKKIDCL